MHKEQILQMAFELGAAIGRSPEYDSMQALQSQVADDRGASDLIASYQQAMMQLENKRRDGLDILPDELQRLEAMQQELSSHELVKELVQAQEQLNNLIQGVYFAINQAMKGQSCTSDCSSCGGGCGYSM